MKKILCLILTALTLLSLTAAISAESYISHSGWKVTASSVNKNSWWAPEKMIDDNEKSIWHSAYETNDSNTEIVSNDKPPFILTFTLPKLTEVSGFSYTPRQDNMTGVVTACNIYVSDKDDGDAVLIFSGKLAGNKDVQNKDFGYNISVKKVVFEITEAIGGFGTCAEFNLIDKKGTTKKTIEQASLGKTLSPEENAKAEETGLLDRKDWKVTASSSYDKNPAEKTIDGNERSYWHSKYNEDGSKDEAPFTLTYTLPSKTEISGFRYVPRSDNRNGIATAYNVYVSETDGADGKIVYSGNFDGSVNTQNVDFGFNVSAKKVIFEIKEGVGGYGTCAEFYLFSGKEEYETKNPDDIKVDTSVKITDKSRWTAEASSEKLPQYPAKNAIDGKTGTIWHSGYTDDGVATVLSKEPGPHWLSVTLPEPTVISGFSYTPRKSKTGRFLKYEFYASDSDSGEWMKIEEGEFNDDESEKRVKLPSNVKVKKVKLLALTSAQDFGVMAEFDLFSADSELKTAENLSDYKKLYEENKLIKIANENGEMFATASSVWRTANGAVMAVDGKRKNSWHSSPDDVNKFPVTLNVDMGSVHNVHEIIYYPRTEDSTSKNGIWLSFNIRAGLDKDDLKTVMENVSLKEIWDPQTIKFESPVRARYFEFEILNGVNGYATCGELEFYEPLSEHEEKENQKTVYTLKIGSKTIKIEDEKGVREVETDVAPYIDNGYTQIPLRGLLEQMGATFTWDGEYNKITVDAGGTTIKMQIYNNIVTVTHRIYGEIRYTLRSVPQIKDSRTFVPLRFISENLGYNVEWNPDTQEITVTK